MKSLFANKVRDFRLPRYSELPDVGLYLEQVTKYINGCLKPLGCAEITPSMVSNYVKKGVVPSPVKKQYYVEQIAYLIFITVAKSAASIENLSFLFKIQRDTYDSQTAYDYFCTEFENMLHYICGLKSTADNVGTTDTEIKTMFKSVIIAATHILFIGNCFDEINAPVGKYLTVKNTDI